MTSAAVIDGYSVGMFLGFLTVELFCALYALAAWNIRRYRQFSERGIPER